MITPALVIFLMVIGWGSAAMAMLWGMLRIARHHHRPTPAVRRDRQPRAGKVAQPAGVSLTA